MQNGWERQMGLTYSSQKFLNRLKNYIKVEVNNITNQLEFNYIYRTPPILSSIPDPYPF